MQSQACAAILLVANLLGVVHATKVINSKLGNLDESDVLLELDIELGSVVDFESERLQEMREGLGAMYKALPKNAAGKLSRKVVRYALHRFFVKRNSWFIRGLEPTRGTEVADADHHTSNDLREWVPSYLQDLFETRQHAEGADLDGLVVLAAALEDIVRLEAHTRLEVAYELHGLDKGSLYDRAQVERLIWTWYAEFQRQGELEYRRLAGLDLERTFNETRTEFTEHVPTWKEDWKWVQGLIGSIVSQHGKLFKFDTVARVVDEIERKYHSRNDPMCEDLKATLHGLESAKPGRIRLSAFYQEGSKSNFGFAEKKEYLYALGALDESEPGRPYVIIDNYVTSRTNCFAPSDVYLNCCRSSCEEYFGEIEVGIGAASAAPSDIVAIVRMLPSPFEEVPRELSSELLTRISQVAEIHGGQVPLHGRLFAQWMHHVYPRECPYPHQEGGVNPRTPSEWLNETGQSTQASEEELLQHAGANDCVIDAAGVVDCGESDTIPWDVAEELLSSIDEVTNSHVAVPSSGSRLKRLLQRACYVVVAGLLCVSLLARLRGAGEVRRSMSMQQPRFVLGLVIVAAYVSGLIHFGLIVCMLIYVSVAAGVQKVSAKGMEGCREGCAVDKLV